MINKKAPDFVLPATGGNTPLTLSDLLGHWVVVFFYPQDNTFYCTKEACSFRNHYDTFSQNDTKILGISPDSLQSHEQFIEKYELPYPLLSDTNHYVSEQFSVWDRVQGVIIRSTFIIDSYGYVKKEYRDVDVKNHVHKVLEDLQMLKTSEEAL